MTAWAFYNEHEPFAAQWIRELIKDGAVAPGYVDERDVRDIHSDDLREFTQVHLFGGVAGWSLALRLAGVPDERPVWTGSVPCQPFSAAGGRAGFADERHLWPAFFHLIRECRPPVVLGEQVEAAVRLGWLDLVSADLEGKGYAFGAAVLGAHSVGAPHIRQRLFWVADAQERRSVDRMLGQDERTAAGEVDAPHGYRFASALADADGRYSCSERQQARWEHRQQPQDGSASELGDAGREGRQQVGSDTERRSAGSGAQGLAERPLHKCACGMGIAPSGGWPRFGEEPAYGESRQAGEGPWSDLEWLSCRDGKARPAQPGIQPLAHGVPNRVGTLRGAGNAIVPQVAAEFVRAYLDAATDLP